MNEPDTSPAPPRPRLTRRRVLDPQGRQRVVVYLTPEQIERLDRVRAVLPELATPSDTNALLHALALADEYLAGGLLADAPPTPTTARVRFRRTRSTQPNSRRDS